MKGCNRETRFFKDEFLVDKRNFWSHKFWIVFNEKVKNIEMYEAATMKIRHILPFHYFDVWGFKWNQEQSSFIAYHKHGRQYCFIERI